MTRPKTVITHWVHDEVIDVLSEHCEVISNPTRDSMEPERLLMLAGDAEALMVFMPDSVDRTFLDRCPRLKIVSAALKGFDNFDVAACTDRGVWFTNVPDLLTVPTAELAIGHLISLGRNMTAGDRMVRKGSFPGWRPVLYGRGLAGSTVGILGMGAVGQAIAERLLKFSCRVLYYDRQPLAAERDSELGIQPASPEEIYAASHFVVIALPLNENTVSFIDAAALSAMRSGAYLVNVGRGSCVDEKAVAEALENGSLAGYGADVFAFEDWARDDRPAGINERLLRGRDNTLLTPHIGSAVEQVRLEIAMEAAANVIDVLHGYRPRGAVNNL
jgi:phosphonate dehydrogenase